MRDVSQIIFKRMRKGSFFSDLNRSASLLFTPPSPAAALPVLSLQGDVASPEFPPGDEQSWKQAFGELPFAALLFPQQQQQRYFLPTLLPTRHFKGAAFVLALYQSTRYSAVNYLKIETSPARCLPWSWSPNPMTETKGWERQGT